MRSFAVLVFVFAFLAGSPAEAKDDKAKKQNSNAKRAQEQSSHKRGGNETGRSGKDTERQLAIPRRTEGHRPHDSNGDGVITRHEWPGNDVSFQRLDRDGDGVISRYDRSLNRDRGDEVHRSRTDRFSGADRNRDGLLQRGEWPHSDREFSRLDRDGNGVLSRDEYRQ
jgi:hypothetical protein